MSLLQARFAGDRVILDASAAIRDAAALQPRYVAADPFPHLVLDEFLPDELARRLYDTFPPPALASVSHKGPHQHLERGYRPDTLGAHPAAGLLQDFNTAPLLQLLEALTGHRGLLPDPYFVGGGFHEIERGGHLAVHADFNLHQRLGLVRRINLIVFLNPGWDEAWGGALELWDRGMTRCVASIAPLFNRAVLFDTDKTSFHGHPEPLACPPGRTRRSLALYYYASPSVPREHAALNRRTDWQVRPGTEVSRPAAPVWYRILGRLRRALRAEDPPWRMHFCESVTVFQTHNPLIPITRSLHSPVDPSIATHMAPTESPTPDEPAGGSPASRQPYRTPVLTDHGSLEEHTRSLVNSPPGPDAGSS